MKIDLGQILKTLGIPVGFVALFSVVLSLLGVNLDEVLSLAGAMVGFQFAVALVIDVLKFAGVIEDGIAGKVSAGLNLALIVGIVAALKFAPGFDLSALDGQIKVFAEFAAVLFGLIIQLLGTKSLHGFIVKGLGVKSLSFSDNPELGL